MDTLERMQSHYPHIYDVYSENSVIRAILSIYAERHNISASIMDRLDAMVGVSTTYDEDLQHRWGSLLDVEKSDYETYDEYRYRLSTMIAYLNGGTPEAIKFAVASVLGISSDQLLMDQCIKVYDGWKYDDSLPYGSAVVELDMATITERQIYVDLEKVTKGINSAKASGVDVDITYLYFLFDTGNLHITDEYIDEVLALRAITNIMTDTLNNSFILNKLSD